MTTSVFYLFKIGIGPSSSHTVGPMRAAALFATDVAAGPDAARVTRVQAELFGSLGATGHGHGSEPAVLMGLEGADPETVDTAAIRPRAEEITSTGILQLVGRADLPVPFTADNDLILHRNKRLPFHPNAMTFRAWTADAAEPLT